MFVHQSNLYANDQVFTKLTISIVDILRCILWQTVSSCLLYLKFPQDYVSHVVSCTLDSGSIKTKGK
jgi:hypothetical protein